MRTFFFFLIAVVIGIASTLLMNHFIKAKKYLKYLLPIFLLILSFYYVINAKTMDNEGFRDLANIIIAMFLGTVSISGLITAFIIDFYKKI